MINQSSGQMAKPTNSSTGQIGLFAAMAIGIGGKIGAGIFSILGVVAQAAGTAMWLSFVIGGTVALLSTYSYAKLGARYPSAGGAVEFLVKGFGDGVLSGGINLYHVDRLRDRIGPLRARLRGVRDDVRAAEFTSLASQGNRMLHGTGLYRGQSHGARVVGGSETFIVVVKLLILFLFAGAGLFFIQPRYLALELWPPATGILFGAGVLFIGYEGFGLVANAAEDMDDPRRLLPKALYMSVIIVILIYVAVSVAVVGNLDIRAILKLRTTPWLKLLNPSWEISVSG